MCVFDVFFFHWCLFLAAAFQFVQCAKFKLYFHCLRDNFPELSKQKTQESKLILLCYQLHDNSKQNQNVHNWRWTFNRRCCQMVFFAHTWRIVSRLCSNESVHTTLIKLIPCLHKLLLQQFPHNSTAGITPVRVMNGPYMYTCIGYAEMSSECLWSID